MKSKEPDERVRPFLDVLVELLANDVERDYPDIKMKPERWEALEASNELPLTEEEIKMGWHFCPDWDGLLVGPGMTGELESCLCDLPNKLRSDGVSGQHTGS